MIGWRRWALLASALVIVAGLVLLSFSGNPTILIIGGIMAITTAIEPIYGLASGRPTGAQWSVSDERFIDPESGKMVTVWLDPETGERRYVEEK